jgi:transposase
MSKALGIDVAKQKLDVVLLDEHQHVHSDVFPNSAQGFHTLQSWLTKHSAVGASVCLEATGQYSEMVALFLHREGYPVSVVNPARIKAFAASRLSRQKTDQVDARLIALFSQTQQPLVWTPPDPAQRTLQALVRYLRHLKMIRQQEVNRLGAGVTDGGVIQGLQRHIVFLDQQIVDLNQQIETHLTAYPHLHQQFSLLNTIPGLGATSIATLLAEVTDIRAFDTAAQLAAYAGVTPRHHRSGSSVRGRTRISKCGNPALRAALYFPAMVALRHNPIIRAFGERLRANGVAPKAVVVAAIRKLLHLIYGILKSGQPFNPNYAIQGAPA